MLNEFLFTKIEEENIGNIWFQHDVFLFGARILALGLIRKHTTYYTTVTSKENIREAIGKIQLHTIDNVIWTDRAG